MVLTESATQATPALTCEFNNNRWGIVLATGDIPVPPFRLRGRLVRNRPRQYCTLVGSRSIFQHTIDRTQSLVPAENLITLIGPGHHKFLTGAMNRSLPGLLVEPPVDLGTAPGFFLAAAYVLAQAPNATLLVCPSDQFVFPEEEFCRQIRQALHFAEVCTGNIILVGAEPTESETECGWIDPKHGREDVRSRSRGVMAVENLREKPERVREGVRLVPGGLRDTMILAVRGRTLWDLARLHLPEIMYRFEAFLRLLKAIHQGQSSPEFEAFALERLYEELPPADLWEDLLRHCPHQSLVFPLTGVDWCDWANPQQVIETLDRLRRPEWEDGINTRIADQFRTMGKDNNAGMQRFKVGRIYAD